MSAVDGQGGEALAAWQSHVARPLVEPPPGGRPVTSYREFYLDHQSEQARVAFIEQRTGKKGIASPGAMGLLLSMTALVERALDEGWESVLILEDDVLFHRDTTALFERSLDELPPDWVILQLGAMQLHWEEDWITWHSRHLYRCHGSSIGAHAVGLRRPALVPLLEGCRRHDLPFDIGALHGVKRRFADRCFTVFPNVAIQDASDSEIGMSTLFFREARKVDNLYRWHLPDYGPATIGMTAPGRGKSDARHQEYPGREPVPVSHHRTPSALLARARAALAARLPGRPSPAWSPPSARSTAAGGEPVKGGLQPLRVNGGRSAAVHVLAVVVGLAEEELEAVVERTAGDRAVVPVFLTDQDGFAVFRTRRLAFEYLPPPAARPGLDWELYRLRRLALLRRKWQPVRIVAFGSEASALVRAWRDSPFEDDRIAALTGVPAPG
jgi:GR25 family glycosyltransferase involved in LPS biosynthesis